MLHLRSLPRMSGRFLHTSRPAAAITQLTMPALSPTMTEGSVSDWKVKEGDKFVAGEVLLQIETDKASIEVEAQDDGVMGKIIVANGTSGVEVGKVIALLAEEDDDISNLVAPPPAAPSPSPALAASTPTPPPSPPTPSPSKPATPTPLPVVPTPAVSTFHPTHPLPLLPSVMRLLALARISDASIITATGHKGLLTKGDVLAHLGTIKNARGSEKIPVAHNTLAEKVEKAEPKKIEMDGQTLRQLITFGLSSTTYTSKLPKAAALGFDEILAEYSPPKVAAKGKPSTDGLDAYFDL